MRSNYNNSHFIRGLDICGLDHPGSQAFINDVIDVI